MLNENPENLVLGNWRITGMEAPAHITVREDLTGEFHFGLVQGEINAHVGNAYGEARVEFSCSGVNENDQKIGRGWIDVTGDEAQGCIYIRLGDDSAFTAIRVG